MNHSLPRRTGDGDACGKMPRLHAKYNNSDAPVSRLRRRTMRRSAVSPTTTALSPVIVNSLLYLAYFGLPEPDMLKGR